MKKRKYNIPKVRISRMHGMQQLLLSSGVEIGIPQGAKENSIFEDYESDEE